MDHELLEDLRAGRGPLSAERLVTALRTAHKPVDEFHRQATQIWRVPLSLFDAKSAESSTPQWAINVALEGQRLVEEAIEVNDLREAYETQIRLAKEEGRGVASAPVAKLLERLHSMHQKFQDFLPRLRDARSCLDDPGKHAAMPPPATEASSPEHQEDHRLNIMQPKPRPPSALTQALRDMESSVGAVLGGLGVLRPKKKPAKVPEVMPIPGAEVSQTSQPSESSTQEPQRSEDDKDEPEEDLSGQVVT